MFVLDDMPKERYPMKNKFLAALLAGASLLTMTACGGNASADTGADANADTGAAAGEDRKIVV